MKKTNRLLGVIAIALILAIALPGVALASVSYEVLVVEGTLYAKDTYDQTSTGLPFDGGSYDLLVRAHNCDNVSLKHFVDFDRMSEVEADTVVHYMPDNRHMIVGVFFEESIGVDKIASTGNESDGSAFCFTADAGLQVNADYLNLETSAYTSNEDRISYEVAAVGVGSFAFDTEVYINEGVIDPANGTATFEHYRTIVGARDTPFQFGGTFYEDLPELPPFVPAQSGMCPFMSNP